MSFAPVIANSRIAQNYLTLLLTGDRTAVREMIDRALVTGMTPGQMLSELVWPTMESIQRLYKEDEITQMQLNLATRLNRSICDQLAGKLPRGKSIDRKVLIFCGNAEPEELGGQIAADLFESAGYTVRFGGGGVANDEILKMIGDFKPDLLVMFATLPSGVPSVRKLFDYLRDVNSCPNMQVMCCGGIYKRAEGLSDEIGADLYAPDAAAAVEVAESQRYRRASLDQQTVGRMRRIKKAAIRRGDNSEMAMESEAA
ncbi:MAG TPA: B12-binding domain-containing protein [Tepidisphaeraceae bacterium]|jgi:methanogenic corrinoid protein MtbC1